MKNISQEKKQWMLLVEILEDLLQERVGITEGCREVYRLRSEVGMENDLFLPFVGFYSESDSFPLGKVRELWSEEGLNMSDKDREKVEAHYKEWVFDAAKKLLEHARNQY